MNVQLIRMDADESQEAIQLEEFPVVVGRSPDADVQIADRWISRRHCELDVVKGKLIVTDLASRNGTCINGHPINCAPLLPGDRLSVGMTQFTASYDRDETVGEVSSSAQTSRNSCHGNNRACKERNHRQATETADTIDCRR